MERKPPENFDVWDCCMRGNWYLSRRGKDDVSEARRLFETGLELDPNSTMALSGLALTLGWSINFGWVDDLDEARAVGLATARKAVNLDENDAGALVGLAIIRFYMHQLDEAVAACRRALDLNPNLALAEGWLAAVLGWRGDYDEAALHAEKATRLSPRDTFSIGSFAHAGVEFGAGRYEQAVEWARKTVEVTPEFPGGWRYLAGSLAFLGRLEEARAAKDQLLRLMPHENLRLVRAALPSVNRDRMDRFVDGMRKACVPE